jgi:hypothetical protein
LTYSSVLVAASLVAAAGVAALGAALPDDRAAMLAFALAAVVVTAVRQFAPVIPAVAAPLAVAWPHGAPAIGAGVLIAATVLARPLPMPGLAIGAVFALAAWIGIAGDSGLVRGGAACVAVAVAAPVCIRSDRDFRLAAGSFGLTAAGIALGAALLGVTGARADILAVSAALGLAASAGVGLRSIAAADLAGVLVLPSRAGLISVAVALVALLVLRRLAAADGFAAAVAIAAAWLAGAPAARAAFVHGTWARSSGYLDAYHRLGVTGLVLFALLLLAALSGLPQMLMPTALAAGAGAALAPLEATAPVWLFAGLAAAGTSYHRSVAGERERALDRREQELEAERSALAEAQRRLSTRRAALDQREAELNRPRPPGDDEVRRLSTLEQREAAVDVLERTIRERDHALDTRERLLTEREAANAAQEEILRQRDTTDVFLERNEAFRLRELEVTALERELAAREAELNKRVLDLDDAVAERTAARQEWELTVARREHELGERERAFLEREQALADRERELTRREAVAPDWPRERRRRDAEPPVFRRRERKVEEPPPRREPGRFPWREPAEPTPAPPPPPVQPVREPQVVAPPPPAPPVEPVYEPVAVAPRAEPVEELLQPAPQYWSLAALRRLVAKRLVDFPERTDEWQMYLNLFAEHQIDGLLPPSLDSLVLDVFGSILDARSA